MARELFVYWKVTRDAAPAAHAAAVALVRALRETHPGLQVRLLRRADEAGYQATFMETYRAPGGISDAVQAAIQAQAEAAFAGIGLPARHVEVFDSLDG